jgi:RNA-directed DNA polymerase
MRLVSMRYLETLLQRDRSELRAIGAKAGGSYRSFDLMRPGTGKWRHIDNPTSELKSVQAAINSRILAGLRFPESMFGGIKGRSIRENARLHLRSKVLVTIDIRDCFPRTSDRSVFAAFRKYLGCSADIASLLTKLTTRHHHVPQGAPTSNAVVNMCLIPLHDELEKLAKERDLRFSMYIDDVAFSGDRALEVIEPAIRAIQQFGYAIRRKKLKIAHGNQSQVVTGITVNRILSVARVRRADLSSRIRAAARTSQVSGQELASILGAIRQIRSVNASQGGSLERFAERLLSSIPVRAGEGLARSESRECRRPRRRHSRKRDRESAADSR